MVKQNNYTWQKAIMELVHQTSFNWVPKTKIDGYHWNTLCKKNLLRIKHVINLMYKSENIFSSVSYILFFSTFPSIILPKGYLTFYSTLWTRQSDRADACQKRLWLARINSYDGYLGSYLLHERPHLLRYSTYDIYSIQNVVQ